MEKNEIIKKCIWIIVLVVISLISIFGLAKVTSSPESHKISIQSLDNKKMTVMELTAASAGTATALALVPGDATTPIANQVARLSSYLLIIVGAIFLEKILLTLTGYITFTYLIPIACLLLGVYVFIRKDCLKKLALKLIVFGLILFMVVPISIKISDLIEATYQTTINQTIEETKNTEVLTEDNINNDKEDSNGLSGFVSTIKDAITKTGDKVNECVKESEQVLSKFIDSIAVLLITSCVIPIGVLIFLVWIVKIIFGINIPNNVEKLQLYNKKAKLENSNVNENIDNK